VLDKTYATKVQSALCQVSNLLRNTDFINSSLLKVIKLLAVQLLHYSRSMC
jgi:hypothetical protein